MGQWRSKAETSRAELGQDRPAEPSRGWPEPIQANPGWAGPGQAEQIGAGMSDIYQLSATRRFNTKSLHIFRTLTRRAVNI